MTQRICEILAEKLDCDISELSSDTKFADLGVDSLDIAEIIMQLENEFSTTIKFDASIVDIKTLAEKIGADAAV